MTRITGLNIQFSGKEMTKMRLGLALILLALLGCGGSSDKEVNVCDISLQKCVQTLGEKHKEKCYTTYHACVVKKD
jgi:hypothetical protein